MVTTKIPVRLFIDNDYYIDCLTKIPLKFYYNTEFIENTINNINCKYFEYTSNIPNNALSEYHTYIFDIYTNDIDIAYNLLKTFLNGKVIVLIKHLKSYINSENNYLKFKIVTEEVKST